MASDSAKGFYAELSREFDVTYSDVRGGVSLTYITGEQVIRRLNEVLGVDGWQFVILQNSIHAEADEAWVLGELIATIDGHEVRKQQFGSQKLKRSRSTGAPLDIGFDMKGASTDALKKCATMIGVGLYLSRKEPERHGSAPQRTAAARPANRPTPISQQPRIAVACAQCKSTNLANGGVVGGSTYCGDCYKKNRGSN
jgi:hypothetical protein